VTSGMVEIAEGKIRKPLVRTFPLAKLGEAEALMEARDFFGKIIMIP
jgi:NADPH:quinone reductase-like Zn-dependent oxidoreductase